MLQFFGQVARDHWLLAPEAGQRLPGVRRARHGEQRQTQAGHPAPTHPQQLVHEHVVGHQAVCLDEVADLLPAELQVRGAHLAQASGQPVTLEREDGHVPGDEHGVHACGRDPQEVVEAGQRVRPQLVDVVQYEDDLVTADAVAQHIDERRLDRPRRLQFTQRELAQGRCEGSDDRRPESGRGVQRLVEGDPGHRARNLTPTDPGGDGVRLARTRAPGDQGERERRSVIEQVDEAWASHVERGRLWRREPGDAQADRRLGKLHGWGTLRSRQRCPSQAIVQAVV